MNTLKNSISINLLKPITYLFLLLIPFVSNAGSIPQIKKTNRDIYARFENFTPRLGKESGKISTIIQDRYGYIWLGGLSGLYRFDGTNVRHYINNWSPRSLPATEVYDIKQDPRGRLWIATSSGLCYYKYDSDDFARVFVNDSSDSPSDVFFVREVLIDGDSLIWFDTEHGRVYKMDAQSLDITATYKHHQSFQPYYLYHTLLRDKNKIWIGGRNIGPIRLDLKNNKLYTFPISGYTRAPGVKFKNDVSYYYIDKHDNFWVGSTDGIYLYDREKKTFDLFYKSSSWSILEDHTGQIWFAIAKGLMRFNPETGEATLYFPEEENDASLVSNYIYDLFEDNYHQIWIATANGVSVFKLGSSGVKHLFHIPSSKETLISSSVSSLAIDKAGMVWVGTTGKGIDRLNPETLTITHFNKENTNGLAANNIRSINISPANEIYVSLWAGVGFGVLHPDNNSFTLYTYWKANHQKDWYNEIAFDSAGRTYLGFWGGFGLMTFDINRGTFGKSYQYKFNKSFMSRLITCLEVDKNNNLWMGTTSTGLHLYLPDKDTSIWFSGKKTRKSDAVPMKIYDVKKDPSGNIWIATSGLYLGSANNKTVKKIMLNKKYENIQVYSVLPEDSSTVWLMTNLGTLKYFSKENSIIDYSSAIKLQYKEDNAAAVKLNDGRLLFGGKNGLVLVDPSKVKLGNPAPAVFLSSMYVFDKLKVPSFSNLNEVTLTYKENFFRIHIGTNVWGKNSPFRYYYKLNGFNKDWVETGASDLEARFTNVPPGRYDFLVKAEDDQGNKYNNLANCSVIITPPFWQKGWFIFLVFLTVALLLWYFWWSRTKNLRLSVFNMELNQKLLRVQMNPHFIFNSLSAIQNYIYSNQTNIAGEYLSDFAHLVRKILNNSRYNLISFTDELETVELYLKLQKLRFSNKFDYTINADDDIALNDYQIPPMLAQPLLENAIEHGVKNLDRKGLITIKYTVNKKTIRCEIEDNGIGLTASRRLKKKSDQENESVALSIVKQRLQIFSKKKKIPVSFSIEEVSDTDNNVKGTRVIYEIPFF